MEGGQGPLEESAWSQGYHSGLQSFREEVSVLEGEIQKVESELLTDPDNKVLNRKFERLTDEKRNKEARRERLELQLAGPSEHLYPTGQASPLLAPQHDVHLQPPHAFYQLQGGVKRVRDEEGHEYAGYAPVLTDGIPPQQQLQPPKGTGRGGRGGHKFCKRCKERITYGHQQKCKFCRKCFDDDKQLVLRTDCPHGHEQEAVPGQQMLVGTSPLEQHQADLEAQQHHLQLRLEAAGQPGMAVLQGAPPHDGAHHMPQPHSLGHSPGPLEDAQLPRHEEAMQPGKASLAGYQHPPHLQQQPALGPAEQESAARPLDDRTNGLSTGVGLQLQHGVGDAELEAQAAREHRGSMAQTRQAPALKYESPAEAASHMLPPSGSSRSLAGVAEAK